MIASCDSSLAYGSKSSLFGLKRLPFASKSASNPAPLPPRSQPSTQGQFRAQQR